MLSVVFVLLDTWAATTAAASVASSSASVQVFKHGEFGAFCIRIPSVVQVGNAPGAPILAVAECRFGGGSNGGLSNDDCWPANYTPTNVSVPLKVGLCTKISYDSGLTWKPTSSNITGMMASQNPVLTYDTVNKRVLLVFSKVVKFLQYYDLWSTYSVDGITWSTPVSHDLHLQKLSPPRNGTSPGPGNGLQLSVGEHSGRIIIPTYWNMCGTDDPAHPDCAAALFSDDGGKTFFASDIPTTSGWYVGFSESTAAQAADGTVILNMRNSLSGTGETCNCRGYALSDDGGRTFGKVMFDHALLDPGVARGCEGSLVSISSGNGVQELFFSNPHNDTARQNLVVQRANSSAGSPGTLNWVPFAVVGPSVPAAYSCLASLRKVDGTFNIGMLYETNAENKSACIGMCQIKFLPIDLSDSN